MQVTAIPLSLFGDATVAQVSQDQTELFGNLFWAFLILGTLVGVVVISYILYNVYKYRDATPTPEGRYDIEETEDDDNVARPKLGEIPTGVGKAKGKKLFLSFAISAVIVVSLVTFAYWNLLIVEGTPDDEDIDSLDITVDAFSFGYDYEYPSGYVAEGGPLVVPEDRVISLNVTACHPDECIDGGQTEVWHTWSSPDLRASTDAMPGQYSQTWFVADEPGDYRVECRELCGAGHSGMNFDDGDGVVAKSEDDWTTWCGERGCMEFGELAAFVEFTDDETELYEFLESEIGLAGISQIDGIAFADLESFSGIEGDALTVALAEEGLEAGPLSDFSDRSRDEVPGVLATEGLEFDDLTALGFDDDEIVESLRLNEFDWSDEEITDYTGIEDIDGGEDE